jgi:hypothetical protein
MNIDKYLMKKNLSNNPLSVKRGLPTVELHIDQIYVPEDLEEDKIFIEKYKKYVTGKIRGYRTRLSLNKIKPGFYQPSHNGLLYKCDKRDEESIACLKSTIKAGGRSPLYLYENINKQDKEIYLCPDDINLFFAYLELNVLKPPVMILGHKQGLEESCYVVKSITNQSCSENGFLENVFPVNSKLQPSILGKNKNNNANFDILIEKVNTVKKRIREFHQGENSELHYHHTLFSTLQRAEDTLLSMKLLFEAGLYVNAGMLLRSLYELSLNFYIDWLAPDWIYQFMQMASVMKLKEWEKFCNNSIQKGILNHDLKIRKEANIRAFLLASKVSEKAKVFPLGEKHYLEIYSFLSKIGHHDFSMIARYNNTIEQGDNAVYNEDIIRTVIHYSDFYVAAIVTRIIDDIGY